MDIVFRNRLRGTHLLNDMMIMKVYSLIKQRDLAIMVSIRALKLINQLNEKQCNL